jgi:hypothetical protein
VNTCYGGTRPAQRLCGSNRRWDGRYAIMWRPTFYFARDQRDPRGAGAVAVLWTDASYVCTQGATHAANVSFKPDHHPVSTVDGTLSQTYTTKLWKKWAGSVDKMEKLVC